MCTVQVNLLLHHWIARCVSGIQNRPEVIPLLLLISLYMFLSHFRILAHFHFITSCLCVRELEGELNKQNVSY